MQCPRSRQSIRGSPPDLVAAEALLQHHARTFAFAARFLRPERRQSVVVLYAFSRTLDDLVDERDGTAAVEPVRAELDAWRDWLLAGQTGRAPREPLGSLLAGVIDKHRIPVHYLTDLVDGLASDLIPREFTSFSQLHHYCYQVASTVGLAMAHVLDATRPEALAAAADLGVAMQLTNILRDIGADLGRGRVYLPLDELLAAGSSPEALARLVADGRGPDEPLRQVIRLQIDRARDYYARGLAGVWLLPPDCRLPILIAGRLYRRILDVIERNDYDTLRQRAVTTRREKLREAAIAIMLVRLWRDGENLLPQPGELTGALVRR